MLTPPHLKKGNKKHNKMTKYIMVRRTGNLRKEKTKHQERTLHHMINNNNET